MNTHPYKNRMGRPAVVAIGLAVVVLAFVLLVTLRRQDRTEAETHDRVTAEVLAASVAEKEAGGESLAPGSRSEVASDSFVVRAQAVREEGTPCLGLDFWLLCVDGPGARLNGHTLAGPFTTDAGGRFETGPLERGTWQLQLRTAGWTFAHGVAPLAYPEHGVPYVQVRIVLVEDALVFRGIVRHWSGAPVHGARISVSGSALSMMGETNRAGRFALQRQPESHGKVAETVDVVLGPSDGYHLVGLWPCGDAEHEFILPAPGTLSVRVYNPHGLPEPSFSARIASLVQHCMPEVVVTDGRMEAPASGDLLIETNTGVVTAGPLKPGRYLVSCKRPPGSCAVGVVEVVAGVHTTAALRYGAPVDWRVVDAQTGAPVAGAELTLGLLLGTNMQRAHWLQPEQVNAQVVQMPGGVAVVSEHATTDTRGIATMASGEVLGGGEEVVAVRAEGYSVTMVPARARPDHTVRLSSSETVHGTIAGWAEAAAGLGLPDAGIYARLVEDPSVLAPSTIGRLFYQKQPLGADGTFVIPGLRPGLWELIAAGNRGEIALATFSVPAPSDILVDARSIPSGQVSFVVKFERPVAEASLGIHQVLTLPFPTRSLPIFGGRTAKTGVLHGRTKIEVRTSDSAFSRVLVTEVVVAGREQECEIVVPYREALIDVGAEHKDALFGVKMSVDAILRNYEYRLPAHSGRLRLVWAPRTPFWLATRRVGTGDDVVYGPFEIGARSSAAFRLPR